MNDLRSVCRCFQPVILGTVVGILLEVLLILATCPDQWRPEHVSLVPLENVAGRIEWIDIRRVPALLPEIGFAAGLLVMLHQKARRAN